MPPSISSDGRGWCVSTNTGVWNGGFGPHQPRHSSSVPTPVHGPPPAELAPAHDLGADAEAVPLGKGVVDAHAAAGLATHRAPEPGGEHPLVQTLPGVAERGVEREAIAGSEPVERDREVVHADLGHDASCHSKWLRDTTRRIVSETLGAATALRRGTALQGAVQYHGVAGLDVTGATRQPFSAPIVRPAMK